MIEYNGYTGEKDFKFNSIEENDLHKESKIKSKKIENQRWKVKQDYLYR